jgi:aerobic carbon-monoxide dehydrogenase medium subunit
LKPDVATRRVALSRYLETVSQISRVEEPGTLREAVERLGELGVDGAALAGGTWTMRAPLRGERPRAAYVSLRRLDELRGSAAADGELRIGALQTHAELARLDGGPGPLGALAEAARRSAFPAVRNVATLGGNLAAPFPEADLVPALLAADASLELARPDGELTVGIDAWVQGERPDAALIVAVRVPVPERRRAWFERLTVRAGAEYSLASVAVSVDLDDAGVVGAARVAVGAVEDVPRRVDACEAALIGSTPAAAADDAGRAAEQALAGRDGLDAPGWYRTAVLPSLIRRALARLED